jgi:hypothetical protein
MSKITLATLLANFDFSFTDGIKASTFKMPANNLLVSRPPEVYVKITKTAKFTPFMY